MENSAKAPAIEARGLTRTFKGDVEAVRGVDLSVPQGEIFGFLGPNGAGKSTTIRMLCTLLTSHRAAAPSVAGHDVVDEGDRSSPQHRSGSPGDRARPGPDRARAARAPVRPLRDHRTRQGRERTDGAARAGRA